MKTNHYIACLAVTFLISCGTTNMTEHEDETGIPGTFGHVSEIVKITAESESPGKARLPALADAERILGEKAKLSDSSSARSKNVLRVHLTYSAIEKAKQERNLYIAFEEFDDVNAAAKRYAFVRDGNADHEGVEPLTGVGDEAYFHSDGTAFCFIMARKGNKVLTMKVNRMSAMTSVSAFREVAERVVGEM